MQTYEKTYLDYANVLFISVFSLLKQRQTSHSKKTVYLELGGSSLFYSINFENLSRLSSISKLTYGFGAEYLSSIFDYGSAICVIPSANLLFGKESHHFETGLACFTAIGKRVLVPSARIGYRFQPNNGGFVFRAGFTPILFSSSVVPYGGISLGYNF